MNTPMIIDLEKNIATINSQEYQSNFDEFTICYGYEPTPFGECLIAFSSIGVCNLSFLNNDDKAEHFKLLTRQWRGASFVEDSAEAKKLVNKIFNSQKSPIPMILKGTEFQIMVWRALLNIEYGETKTYEDIAKLIGNPSAIRATASAIARNNIAFLIPCHRVILKSGKIHKYRWGSKVKEAILKHESKPALN